MASSIKCPECGAIITNESKFCNYCGARIEDGTKRVEVKIDKRVEDVAEVKRATYEEKESLIRQKTMKREIRLSRIKLGICGAGLLAGIISGWIGTKKYDFLWIALSIMLCAYGLIGLFSELFKKN